MEEIMGWAFSMGLPCIHVENYCGNRFNCVCRRCGHPNLVQCNNILNGHLAGHHDILGISWTIETKHKVNKVKKQKVKLSQGQDFKSLLYSVTDIPHLAINEDGAQEAYNFLHGLSTKKE